MVFTAYRGLCRQKLKSHISSSLWSKENTNHMYNQWLFQVLSVHKSYLFSSVAGPGWKADRETYKEFLKTLLKQKFYKDNSKVKGEPIENLNAGGEEKEKERRDKVLATLQVLPTLCILLCCSSFIQQFTEWVHSVVVFPNCHLNASLAPSQ